MRSKNENLMQDILRFINDSYLATGEVPSVQRIADRVGIAKSTASRYLADMESRGMLSRTGEYYGIETELMRKAKSRVTFVPVVGEVACGTPILAEQNIESYITISGDFLGQGEFFALRAHGESMINVGISDGDYVLVRRQSFADEGQIVVAMVGDGDCTLKRYFLDRRNRMIRLHPENDNMEDMYFDRIEIQGVAVKVIRSIRA